MALAQAQALLARLFTDAAARRAFFADPIRAAKSAGLSEAEAQSFAALDKREVEAFAQTLLGKRALDVRKVLPLTTRALGDRFNALLFEAIDGPLPPGRHRADAAALALSLTTPPDPDPPWIADLARYELAFIEASRPGAALILRRFSYPVAAIARQIHAGAPIDGRPRACLGLWLRPPGGRSRHWTL
jgi:hypothetical protein